MQTPKEGDIGHWTMIWGQELDGWGVYVRDDNEVTYGLGFQMIIPCKAASDEHGHNWVRWQQGFVVHIGPADHPRTKLHIIPPDEVPDRVWVELAKMRLKGEVK